MVEAQPTPDDVDLPGAAEGPENARLLTDPPSADWVPDVLPGFERRTIGLEADGQGQNLVTVVRPAGPREPARRPVLAIHGWSDYFYNAPLAHAFEAAGFAFHAVDLRHYGRSLRAGQTPGWTDDLARYDADLEAALGVIAQEHPQSPVVVAHSTGGLIASLWADRNPGRLAALVLNSPWLEMQGSTGARLLAAGVVDPVSALQPYAMLRLPRVDHYWRTLSAEADGEWDLHAAWRPRWAFEVPAAWLAAVLAGHRRVAKGLDIEAPVLVHVAGRGHRGTRYGEAMHTADIVLNPTATAARALRLGRSVTVQRHADAMHDVFASPTPIREGVMAETVRWLGAYAPPGD